MCLLSGEGSPYDVIIYGAIHKKLSGVQLHTGQKSK